ncbi:unnamed protein product, partial [Didymodactylos carnosus]
MFLRRSAHFLHDFKSEKLTMRLGRFFALIFVSVTIFIVIISDEWKQMSFNEQLCSRIINEPLSVSPKEVEQVNAQLSFESQRLMETNYHQMDCSIFVRSFYTKRVTQVELDFPLAFTILVFKNLYQFQVLLRMIYRQHNFYCIHTDLHAPQHLVDYSEKASKCLKNVYLSPRRISVKWSAYSTLEAERLCQVFLLQSTAGTELPIHTNYELVLVLKLLNGSNDVSSRLNLNPERHLRQSFDPIP